MLHFGKRGRENLREMTAEDVQIHKSSSDLDDIALLESATKNHEGGLTEQQRK